MEKQKQPRRVDMKLKLITAVAAIVACLGAWGYPPASDGWKKLEFNCYGPSGSMYVDSRFYSHPNDYETYDHYKTNQDGETDKHPSYRYISGPHTLTQIFYRLSPARHKANSASLYEIDRSTGIQTFSLIGQRGNVISKVTYECELRPENKF